MDSVTSIIHGKYSWKVILRLPLRGNDAQAATIGEYLETLLLGIWNEKDGFDGKRPFGNSSWEFDIYIALVEAGIVEGKIDSNDGYPLLDEISDTNQKKADEIIKCCIEELFTKE